MSEITEAPWITYTIAVCTFNRAASLEQTLSSFTKLDLAGLSAEVVVIDNNSSDATQKVAEQYARVAPLDVQYVLEPEQGLSIARNRAVREAHGEWIVFTDDDVTAGSNFLKGLHDTIRRTGASCVGGKVLLRYPGERPRWLTDRVDYIYGRVDLGASDTPFSPPYVPIGPSMAVRKDMFERYRLFGERLGLTGTTDQIRRGEEVELAGRLIDGGELVMYSAASIVHHRVDPLRLPKVLVLGTFCVLRTRARTRSRTILS